MLGLLLAPREDSTAWAWAEGGITLLMLVEGMGCTVAHEGRTIHGRWEGGGRGEAGEEQMRERIYDKNANDSLVFSFQHGFVRWVSDRD